MDTAVVYTDQADPTDTRMRTITAVRYVRLSRTASVRSADDAARADLNVLTFGTDVSDIRASRAHRECRDVHRSGDHGQTRSRSRTFYDVRDRPRGRARCSWGSSRFRRHGCQQDGTVNIRSATGSRDALAGVVPDAMFDYRRRDHAYLQAGGSDRFSPPSGKTRHHALMVAGVGNGPRTTCTMGYVRLSEPISARR